MIFINTRRIILIAFVLLFTIFSTIVPLAQDEDNTVFWAQTGGVVPLPDGFSVLITEDDELLMSNIPDIEELPDVYAPGEIALEFNFIGFGTVIPLGADIETAMRAYIDRTLPATPPITLLDIGDRSAASIQTTFVNDGETIGAYLLLVEPARPGAVYPLMGIAYHPSDDISALIALAPQLALQAYLPSETVSTPGEVVIYGDYTFTVPDGFTLLYPPTVMVALTNIPEDRWRLPIDDSYDFQSGDIYIKILERTPELADDTALEVIRAYSGDESSMSWRVGTQNMSGIGYEFPNVEREVHALRRPTWTTDDVLLLDVYARDVSDAVLRTQLRHIIAGLNLPEWSVDNTQTISIDDITLGIPATWSFSETDDGNKLFFVDGNFVPTDYEEANPGDVLVAVVPDAVAITGVDNADASTLIDVLTQDFGAERIYTTREIDIDGTNIIVADITGIEDRSGARTFFAQVFILPPDADGRVTAIQVNYENRIDYETSVQALMHNLVQELLER